MALPWDGVLEGGHALAAGQSVTPWFARPGRGVQPKFRWWWPHGKVDPAEIRREIDQIAAAGFGGVEIADVHHSITAPIDPARYGWGTPAWVAAVEAALLQARVRGLTVDITVGPSWPAAVPSITPASPAAAKELAHGMVTVEGGTAYSGPVPGPRVPPASGVGEQRLLAVHAARISAGSSPEASPVALDAGTVQDLTGLVQDGLITWLAPSGGRWLLISYWERGSGQQPERGPHTDPPAFVIDHFSRAGTQAVIDFWESRILTRKVRKLLRQVGGALFEDSIELETDATLWTPDLPAEFERRMGYPLWPYLPVVVEEDEDPVFTFDAVLTRRVRRDLWEVLTQLYIEHHLEPLQAWAHSLGLRLRIQPYGLETDAIAKAAIVDVPEGESLGFKNLDDFRCLAGGRDMGGKRVLSNEAGAAAGAAYSLTWDRVLRTLNSQYAAGVNQAVLHGFSYADAPGVAWPGFAAFTPYDGRPGYAESWGPRQPTWRHVPDIAGYLGRMQAVLQRGTARADAAVLRQRGYAGTGFGAPWFTADGVPQGWTHQFLSPRLLQLPSAVVRGGRLAPDGPAYKVLVLEGDVFAGRERTLPLDAAERLLALARAGLPIVIVGNWADAQVPGLARPGENERLRALLTELLAQPSVRNVADRPLIPTALADLGIRPDVEYAQRSSLLNLHRLDGEVDYYLLVNGSQTAPVDHDVWLACSTPDGVPYQLDPWTGVATPLAVFEERGGRIRVRVRLRPGQSEIIAIQRHGRRGGRPLHAIGSEADEVRYGGRWLVARAARPGTYVTTLADGRAVATTIPDVPAPQVLTGWQVTVEDWQPGRTATETAVVEHRLTLDTLQAWSDVPELQDVSGIGRYRTTVTLEAAWSGGYGAYLDLGEVLGTFRVTVNGRRLPPSDQLDPIVDVGAYLRRGRNTIEVEVATTLNNRLRVASPEVYGVTKRQRYGLVGPVRLLPYGEAVIPV